MAYLVLFLFVLFVIAGGTNKTRMERAREEGRPTWAHTLMALMILLAMGTLFVRGCMSLMLF